MKRLSVIGPAVLLIVLIGGCGGDAAGNAGPLVTGRPGESPVATASPSTAETSSAPAPTEDGTQTPAPSRVRPSPTAQPTAQLSSQPTARPSSQPPPSSPPASPDRVTVKAYFLLPAAGEDAPRLVPVARDVPRTLGIARAAVDQLLAGATAAERTAGITSYVPSDTLVLGIDLDQGVATIDLSQEFEAGAEAASLAGRVAQVVYTLTQFENITSVRFRLDGRPVAVPAPDLDGQPAPGAAPTERPVGRDDYVSYLPPIFVDRPAWGGVLPARARIVGRANVFEATFRVAILDARGRTLVETRAMATCGTGCWGDFDITVPYHVAASQRGTLRVWDESAQDGSAQDVRDYPVRLIAD